MTVDREYTEEQLSAVKKIKKCKDYYQILGVTKQATESDVKKEYRNLALQFHPDKNKAPGAEEAFKMIAHAFTVLSDNEKRRQYDLYGSEKVQMGHTHQNGYYNYSRGFEANISAEEIFRQFFGEDLRSGNVYFSTSTSFGEPQQHRNHNHNQQRATNYKSLLQMSPVLVLLCFSLMSTLFVPNVTYSLSRTQEYQYERETNNLEIPYFVSESFDKENKELIQRIEQQVEEEYVSNLRASCFRERSYKQSMISRARNYRDKQMENRANGLKTPSCDLLHNLS